MKHKPNTIGGMLRGFAARIADVLPVSHGSLGSSLKIRLLGIAGVNVAQPLFIDRGFRCINPQLITIGHHSSFGHDNHIWAFSHVHIGHHTMTAKDLLIISGSHDVSTFEPIGGQDVTIGPGCWIGARVTILGGVTIGTGCVLGAGAVVRTSLPDWSVAVGIPAKVIHQRKLAEKIWHQFGWYNRDELEATLAN
jgi:acetyltransferase-like isoleucine patch superfamily enzyme